jgi:triacylglycerol lipase
VLARLQQLIVLTWLSAVCVWVGGTVSTGRHVAAVAGVLVLTTAHAIVLGLEFALMHRINRHDRAPRARPGQLVVAWWGEVLGATRVFGWRQPFRSAAFPDQVPEGRTTGVVFIHGFVCNRGLWNPWLRYLSAQGIPFVAVNLEPVFGSIDDYVPIVESAIRRIELATGRPPLVVAHSMGGLALRRWWVEAGNEDRVAHAITIGTPHQGTWLARLALSPNVRQMRQHSPWLRSLAAREPAGRGQRMTCFYGHCDNIVFPASAACHPGAKLRHLPAVAHVHMADRPEPWRELMRRLQP